MLRVASGVMTKYRTASELLGEFWLQTARFAITSNS